MQLRHSQGIIEHHRAWHHTNQLPSTSSTANTPSKPRLVLNSESAPAAKETQHQALGICNWPAQIVVVLLCRPMPDNVAQDGSVGMDLSKGSGHQREE